MHFSICPFSISDIIKYIDHSLDSINITSNNDDNNNDDDNDDDDDGDDDVPIMTIFGFNHLTI